MRRMGGVGVVRGRSFARGTRAAKGLAGLGSGLFALAGLAGPGPAAAEAELDVFLGGAFTQPSRIELEAHIPDPTTPGQVVPAESATHTKFDESVAVGLQIGGWLEPGAIEQLGDFSSWIGGALSASYFQARPQDLNSGGMEGTIHVAPLSMLFKLRVPLLESEVFPAGRIQPYVAIGPAFVLNVLESKDLVFTTRPPATAPAPAPPPPANPPTPFGGTGKTTAASFDVGIDWRAGTTVLLSEHLGVFTEYRYTRHEARFDDRTGSELRFDLQTHHVNAGVTLRF